jgi:hypothetical protein
MKAAEIPGPYKVVELCMASPLTVQLGMPSTNKRIKWQRWLPPPVSAGEVATEHK